MFDHVHPPLLQELFQLSHPVSYLNSKARGVSVDLADPVIQKAQRSVSAGHTSCHGDGDRIYVTLNMVDVK